VNGVPSKFALAVKVILRILLGTVALLALALLIARFAGLNPSGPRPGLWLSGKLITTTVADWSFANSYPTIEVQTRTWYLIPHSVTIWGVGYEGHLYLQAIGSWKHNVVRDPHVRIRIGNDLYDRTVQYVTDSAEYWVVARNMNKKYGNKWPLPKEAFPDVFLRVD
jgi:hypothetical protein